MPFRVASAATVVVAAAACWSQGELSPAMAVFAMVATVVGNALSYRRRAATVAGGQAHPGRLRPRWLRLVHHHRQPQRHPGGHLHRREPAGRALRLGPVHPRLRRPGPARRGLLAGRVGRPDGGGRGPVGRPHPGRLRPGLAGLRCVGARGHVAVDVGHPRHPVARRGRGRRRRWWCWPSLLVAVLPGPDGLHLADLPLFVGQLVAGRQPEQPHRRLPVPARPRRQPDAVPPGSADSSDSPSPSTPGCGPRSATRWSCGSGPPVRASGSARPTTPGTARAGWNRRPPRARGSSELETGVTVRHPAGSRPEADRWPRGRPTSRPSTWPSRGRTWSSTPTTPSGSTSSRAPSP